MSQPAALAPLPFEEYVYEDGEPVDSLWHAVEMALLADLICRLMMEHGRSDFLVGSNNFVYYSDQQARAVREEEDYGLEKRAFRGPDVFWVGGVDPYRERKAWIAAQEGGRLPDFIVELLSASTAGKDRTEKRAIYEQIFRTKEYFLYDPEARLLEGLRLSGPAFRPIRPDPQGRLWSEQLGVFLGLWHGLVRNQPGDWVRLFRRDGSLVPTGDERAQAEGQRADAEGQRADAAERQAADERRQREAAEAELARLRAIFEGRGQL
ncbi:MAG: Uma2 family endonuclease [Acidobacteriota bacterium]|nr:Uma2 family endonuclease [Acidobacteriota bacterium]